MTIKTELDLSDLEAKVQEALKEVGDSIDPEAILDEAGAALLQKQRERFLARENPDDVPWIPSKAGTARQERGLPGTLFDTGILFHSIQLASRGKGERAIETDVPYAKYHQYGTKYLPRRTFLGFSDEDTQLFTSIVQNAVSEALE